MDSIDFTYFYQPPKRYTFEQVDLKHWVEKWCVGKVLNLFAGKVKLDVDEVRVDIDLDMPVDYHIDSYEFLEEWNGDRFGTVVVDPPYSVRKSREKYFRKSLDK